MGPPGIKVPLALIHRLRRGGRGGGRGNNESNKTEGGSSSDKKAEGGSSHKKAEGGSSHKKSEGSDRGGATTNKVEMDSLLGLLRIRIKRGVNLAVRDARSSDPYVIVKMGKQTVYDHDTFSKDDKMGHAEIEIKHLLEALKMNGNGSGNEETVAARVQPKRSNCLASESCVVTQDMCLRLKNVESGEVEIQIQWINLPAASKP
nr:GTPase activating protein 1-like [Ipomoea trifida]